MTNPQNSKGPRPTVSLLHEFPDHAQRIAEIIAGWTVIEMQLIGLLAGPSQISPVVWAMMYSIRSSRGRVKAVRDGLSKLLRDANAPDDLQGEVDRAFGTADSLLTQRDKYAHAIYGKSQEGELVIIRLFAESMFHTITLQELDDQLERASQLNYASAQLTFRLLQLRAPPPTPGA